MSVPIGFDEQLLIRFEGSACSFDQLVAQYERRVYSLALYLTGATEDAEEILTAVFLRLWTKKDEFSQEASASTVIIRLAIEIIAERLEMRAYTAFAGSLKKTQVQSKGEGNSEELSLDLIRAIQRLPFEYGKVFVLRDVLGLGIQEISQVLSLSEKSCRARLQRARLMIRRSLQRDRGEIEATHNINAHEQTRVIPEALV